MRRDAKPRQASRHGRRRAARQLGRPLRARLAQALRAAGALGPADRLLAAVLAVRLRAGAGRARRTRRAGFDWWALLLFLVGSVAMRGAGCTFNDIVDTDIDMKVARTRSRPIPSGQVTKREAALFLVAQALVGLVVLLQFNGSRSWLGVASLVLVAIYPFMKRITWWPQLFLGLAFSWGALVGWTSQTGSLALAAAAALCRARSCGPSATTPSTRCRTSRTTR